MKGSRIIKNKFRNQHVQRQNHLGSQLHATLPFQARWLFSETTMLLATRTANHFNSSQILKLDFFDQTCFLFSPGQDSHFRFETMIGAKKVSQLSMLKTRQGINSKQTFTTIKFIYRELIIYIFATQLPMYVLLCSGNTEYH